MKIAKKQLIQVIKEEMQKFFEGDVVDLAKFKQFGSIQKFIVLSDGDTFEELNDEIVLIEIDPQKVPEEVLDDLDGGYMKNIVESDINGVRVVPITYAMRED